MTDRRKKKVLMVSDLPVETELHVQRVINTEAALKLACNDLEELVRFPDSVKSQNIRRKLVNLVSKDDYTFGQGNLKYRFLTAIDPPKEEGSSEGSPTSWIQQQEELAKERVKKEAVELIQFGSRLEADTNAFIITCKKREARMWGFDELGNPIKDIPESDHNVSLKEQDEVKQDTPEYVLDNSDISIQNPHRKVINEEPFGKDIGILARRAISPDERNSDFQSLVKKHAALYYDTGPASAPNTFSCDNPDEKPVRQSKFPILAKIWKKLWS